MTDGQCRHYRGARSICGAGVDVEQLRDDEQRLPCVVIRGVSGSIPCDERDLPASAAPVPAGRLVSALEQLEARRCPQCRAPIEREATVGANVVAMPCRHRLGRSAA